MSAPVDRRRFLASAAAGVGAVTGLTTVGCTPNKPAVFQKPEAKPYAHLPAEGLPLHIDRVQLHESLDREPALLEPWRHLGQ